jgi:ceramide glucosyltransferase
VGHPEMDMALLLTVIGWMLAGLALLGAGYALLAAIFVRRFMQTKAGGPRTSGPVTILKPLFRHEPGLFANLESFFTQNYCGPVQIVFGVHDDADPAIAVVQSLQAKYPHLDTTIVVDAARYGANAKISNLINIMQAARHDTLILSDSDIAVGPRWLDQVSGALERPGVGIVTCLYTGEVAAGEKGLWSRLAAMGTSYGFLPNVVVGTSLGLAAPCFGSTIALKRETLEQVGGFAAFADCLADDYEIGRAVRAQGYILAMPALGVAHTATERSLAELFRHEQRWNRTIFKLDPAGHLGSAITFGFPFAVMAALLLHFSLIGLGVMGLTLLSRLFLKRRIDASFETNGGSAWLLPLRDLLSFAVFVNSLFGETVHWRGERFEIAPTGAMSQI